MPDILKKILENYCMVKPEKVFPFRQLESGDTCYALYAKGKVDDSAPPKIKRKYGKAAGKHNLLIWKLPRTWRNVPERVTGVIRGGMPSSDESFYNFIYVFAPEIVDIEYARMLAEEFEVPFSEEKDTALVLEAEDLG